MPVEAEEHDEIERIVDHDLSRHQIPRRHLGKPFFASSGNLAVGTEYPALIAALTADEVPRVCPTENSWQTSGLGAARDLVRIERPMPIEPMLIASDRPEPFA